MARTVSNWDERLKRILLIRDYALEKIGKDESISTRSIANYFNDNSYFNISNNTVDVYLNSLERIDPKSFKVISEVLKRNKPKTVADDEVVVRVNKVVELLLSDYTVSEIADILGVSINTINKDINLRMVKIVDKEVLKEVKSKLVLHSFNNLKNQGSNNKGK